jgi:ABC-type Mn2+/Zn2+ transport system permease subunit
MLTLAVAVAVVSTVAGTFIAERVQRPSGPVVITTAAALFLASLLRRRS